MGCGYDTTFFVFRNEKLLKDSDKFFEVDFPELIARKSKVVSKENELSKHIKNLNLAKDQNEITASNYCMLGGDLRDIKALESKLISCGLDFNKPTLIFAECVLNYIAPTVRRHNNTKKKFLFLLQKIQFCYKKILRIRLRSSHGRRKNSVA